MESDVAKTLYQHGSVWVVQTKSFTGTDKLTPADLDKEPDDIEEIFRLGRKHTFPDVWRNKATSAPGKVQALMSVVGEQFFIKGAYYVPFKNTLAAKEGLEKLQKDHRQIGIDMAEALPEIKTEMTSRYPDVSFRWPTPERIMNKFDVSWLVFQINDVGATESDPEDLIAAKKEFQQELKNSYEDLKKEVLKEAHLKIIEACDTIYGKIFETGDKITAATINKPLKIIEKYTQVAELFDLKDIKGKVGEIKSLLESADAKTVRDDWNTATALGEGLKKMADDLDDLSGYSADGTLKRKIKFKKAA